MVDWHKMFTGRPDPNYSPGNYMGIPDSATFAWRVMRFLFATKLGGLLTALFFLIAIPIAMLQSLRKDYPDIIPQFLLPGAFILFICFAFYRGRHQRAFQRRYNGLPETGLWDINVSIAPTGLGKGVGIHTLTIDVRFTKEDWRTIVAMGQANTEMVPIMPDDAQEIEQNLQLYGTKTSPLTPTHLMQGVIQMRYEEARLAETSKNILIENLQKLRGDVESYKDSIAAGDHQERIEI